jgi:hypothetical protein
LRRPVRADREVGDLDLIRPAVALAETVATINDSLRQRAGPDGAGALETAALTHPPSPDHTNGAEEGNGSAAGLRRRRKAAGTA